jgi:hypothetical protein
MMEILHKEIVMKPHVPVAHTCNPSYPRSRDEEDHSSKPAQGNSSARPYPEKPFTKIELVE